MWPLWIMGQHHKRVPMGMYNIILFIFFNLDVYLGSGMMSKLCIGKDREISIKLHKYVFSIEIIKLNVLKVLYF